MEYLSQENWRQITTYLETYSDFLRVWIISPLVLIAIYIFYLYKSKTSFCLITDTKLPNNDHNHTEKRGVFFYLQIAFLVIFVAIYIYLILYDAEFASHDHEQFTYHSVDGRFFGMPIWGSAGRYWPLGLQEYNIISLFSKTPFAYHSFSIVQLLITIPITYLILRPLNITAKLVVILIIMMTPSLVISFFGLIFPERNLIFWLAIFIFSYQKFIKTKSLIYFCLILFATQFLLYYKEPIFLLIGGFATTRLAFQLITDKVWNKPQQYLTFVQKNWCDVSLIILSIIFLIQYFIEISGGIQSSYASQPAKFIDFSTLLKYCQLDLILLTFLVVFLVRLFFLLIKRKHPDLMWDSLAIGNLLYFGAYIKLNLFHWYYLAPIDFIAILYFAKLADPIIISKHKYKILGIAILTTAILIQNIHYSSYAILFRKKSIEARVEIVKSLDQYLINNNNKKDTRLYLPFDGYYAMQFASFLYYKKFSVPIENQINYQQKKNLIIYTSQKYPNDLCVTYRPFLCYYKDNPEETDLTIILPIDHTFSGPKLEKIVPEETLQEFGDQLIKIYHYQPKFTGLEKILLFFATDNLIDKNWLNAYIFAPNKTSIEK